MDTMNYRESRRADFDKKIRVIIADDSALMRKKIFEILSADSEIEVIATVRNGRELVESIHSLKPDVVTIDVMMPLLDGIQALGYIMSEIPTPCVMISAFTTSGAQETIKALELGAIDFIPKPGGEISRDIESVGDLIREKVKIAAKIPSHKLHLHFAERVRAKEEIPRFSSFISRYFAIASSTGGTQALASIIPKLPSDFPASVLVVQHMPAGFTGSLAERLNWQSEISVVEATDNMDIIPAQVVIAKGGKHMVIAESGGKCKIKLNDGPTRQGVKPNADILMESCAKIFRDKTVGIVLTGMGNDGTLGSKAIKENGGSVITEEKSTCVIYGMPKSVVEANLSDKSLPLDKIAGEMKKMV